MGEKSAVFNKILAFIVLLSLGIFSIISSRFIESNRFSGYAIIGGTIIGIFSFSIFINKSSGSDRDVETSHWKIISRSAEEKEKLVKRGLKQYSIEGDKLRIRFMEDLMRNFSKEKLTAIIEEVYSEDIFGNIEVYYWGNFAVEIIINQYDENLLLKKQELVLTKIHESE